MEFHSKQSKTYSDRISGKLDLPLRFVLIHVHPVSARLRFLSTANGICLPEPLPKLSELIETQHRGLKIRQHPGAHVRRCCERWSLPEDQIQLVKDFRIWIDTPRGHIPLYLLQGINKWIFEAPISMQWIELPESFSLLAIEREIMRKVYTWLME